MKKRPQTFCCRRATSSILLFGVLVAALAAPAPVSADPWDSESAPTKKAKPTQPAEDRKSKLTDEARKVLGKSGPRSTTNDEAGTAAAWTIALVVFRGQTAEDGAKLALHKVQTEGNLPGAFSERRGESVIVAVGRFESAESPKAAAEVKRIQDMTVNGQQPFRDALLIPPLAGANLGSMPHLSLVQTKRILGKSALYTLQVAAYGRRDLLKPSDADLAEPRKAAEQAAVRLRQEGEQAFYYHGPRMSMVTIGIFDEADYDPQTPMLQSARLRDARERHPHNLYNGAGIKEKKPGERDGRLQATSLVAVPEK